jgi:hypothetical protein
MLLANDDGPFAAAKKALIRMLDDIAVLRLRDFFCDKVLTTLSPGLLHIVTAECLSRNWSTSVSRSGVSHGFGVAGNCRCRHS